MTDQTAPDTHDFKVEDVWDNGEFLTGATLVCTTNGQVVHTEKFVGTTEEPPGYTGAQLATSAGHSWVESETYSLEERLGPYGLEWQREKMEADHGCFVPLSAVAGSDPFGPDFDPDDLPF